MLKNQFYTWVLEVEKTCPPDKEKSGIYAKCPSKTETCFFIWYDYIQNKFFASWGKCKPFRRTWGKIQTKKKVQNRSWKSF